MNLYKKNYFYYFLKGQKGQEGEIFGAVNLLKLVTETIITDGISIF